MNKDKYTQMIKNRNDYHKKVHDIEFVFDGEMSDIAFNILKESCLIKIYQHEYDHIFERRGYHE